MGDKKENNLLESISNKFTAWHSIIIFIVLIGSGIGNYMVTNYRLDQHDIDLKKIEARVKKTESINYELLIKQLDAIQSANAELNKKIDKTNERVDKVLEILIDK